LNVTLGAVIIAWASYSCSRRWLNTSMCSKPRNPNLQPCPSAGLKTWLWKQDTDSPCQLNSWMLHKNKNTILSSVSGKVLLYISGKVNGCVTTWLVLKTLYNEVLEGDIFSDHDKVYDCVNRVTSLSKLKFYGITGKVNA